MGSKYLKRSATGWYSYRRRVPTRLRKVLGKSEFKESFATKDEALALLKLGTFNQEVEKQLAIAEKQTALGRNLTPAEVKEVASKYLQRLGLHPDQLPVISRVIIWPFLEQLRFFAVPVLERVDGRSAFQHGLR